MEVEGPSGTNASDWVGKNVGLDIKEGRAGRGGGDWDDIEAQGCCRDMYEYIDCSRDVYEIVKMS